MAIIARKSMGAWLCKCTTCKAQWVAENDKGGKEGEKHKH